MKTNEPVELSKQSGIQIPSSFTEKHLRKIVFLLFFFSGIAGLIYEVVWMRALVLVFGSTSFAISTVLASYMGGLALGGYTIGRWIDRRDDSLRIYGLLVIGTGLYAAILLILLKIASPIYTVVYRLFGVNFTVLSICRFFICSILLIVPTTLMGGTLPVLTRFMTRHRETVRINLGRLYALNTFGAVIGCFTSAFFLLPYLGILRTTFTAATIDILAGFIALLLYREASKGEMPLIYRAEETNIAKASQTYEIPPWLLHVILILFAFSGFASLAYEILWTRLLVFHISNSIYAFSIMLTIFLLGISVGSYIFERFFRGTRNLIVVFVIIEILIGVGGLLSIPILIHLRQIQVNIHWMATFWNVSINTCFKALAVMAAPTILIGIAFPLVNTLYAINSVKIGRHIGGAYSINNIGSIFGSVMTGFVIVPFLGTRLGLITIATLNIAVGLAALTAFCFWRMRRTSLILIISALVLILLPQMFVKLIPKKSYAEIFRSEEKSRLTYIKEGIGGTVTIEEFPGYRTISINGCNVAGTNRAFHTTQKLQAHLALLLHPNPKRVMQIGFGSGGTAYSASLHNVEQIDCVEISPVVLDAAPHFLETNNGVLANPKVKVIVDDARSYMRHIDKKYDVILSDSTHPMVAGNGALYTVDYFRQCSDRLKNEGVFSTWLPVYDLRPVDYKIILKSLCDVFPYVYLWHTSIGRNEWTIVQGFKHELLIDYRQLERRMSENKIKSDLEEIYIKDPIDILSLFLMPKQAISAYIAGIETKNTDDNSYIEFFPARYITKGTREKLFREAFAELVLFRVPVMPIVILPDDNKEQTAENMKKAYLSTTAVFRGRLYEMWNDNSIAEQQYLYAKKIYPDNFVAKDLLGILPENKKTILEGIRYFPDDHFLRIDLAHHYFFHGDYRKAWEEYERATTMEPTDQYAYSQSTLCCILLGDYDAAIDTTVQWKKNVCLSDTAQAIGVYRDIVYCERELKYRPDDAELIAVIANLYSEIACFERSMKYINRGLILAPNDPDLLDTLSYIQRILYDLEAVSTAEKALEHDHENVAAEETLRLISENPANPYIFFEKRRESLETTQQYSKILSKDKQHAYKVFSEGMEAWSNSEHNTALAYFKQALDEAPERKEICLYAAEICLFTGNYSDGIAAVEKCLKYIPNDEQLKAALAKLKFNQGISNRSTAEDYLKGAIIYLLNGEYEEGLLYLDKALELNPDIEYGLLNLGSYYMNTGQLEKAKELYEKALVKSPDDMKLKSLIEILDRKFGKKEKENPGSEPTGAEE
jgi:spermidine synthase